MTRQFYILIAFFWTAMSLPTQSSAGLFGPSDYDECILESMKGVTSDHAARLVAHSCRQKFPATPQQATGWVGGWTTTVDGTGLCVLAWSGSRFTPYLKKVPDWNKFTTVKRYYDNGTEMQYRIPKVIWPPSPSGVLWTDAREKKFQTLIKKNSYPYDLDSQCGYNLPE